MAGGWVAGDRRSAQWLKGYCFTVVDHAQRTFTIDGPEGLSGVRLHLDMLQKSRTLRNKFSEFDLRTKSQEAVLEEMRESSLGTPF